MSADQLNEAIQVFQSGDRDQARVLFQELISTDPNNDTAWYYYAALQDDLARRRAALVRVLEINPQHQRARDVLAAMDAAGAPSTPAGSTPPRSTSATRPAPDPVAAVPPPPAQPKPPAAPPEPVKLKSEESAAGESGFALPVSIPGAPERVTLTSLIQDWIALFMAGVNVLMRKPGVYEAEMERASWWRFWLLVGGLAVITAVLGVLGGILGWQGLFGSFSRGLGVLIIMPVVLYVGVWASDWYAKKQGSTIPQYQHAMAAVLPYIPAAVISSVLGIFPLIGILGLIVIIYAWYIMSLGMQGLHQFQERNQNWITVIIFVIVVGIGGWFVPYFL